MEHDGVVLGQMNGLHSLLKCVLAELNTWILDVELIT